LDVAVNNAGIEGLQAAIQDMPVSDWERVMDVNLTGVFRCMKHQIPEMLRQRSGSIINVASIMGVVAAAHASAYVASKHGLIGLTRAASLELASHGIRVNAVCPAYIVTPMLERAGVFSDPGTRHAAEALHPLGRLGDAEEVASLIHWLGSEEASFVTGAAMMVDGGYTVQ
jgi:NAD(P)-dependent dehydrogenase (short-subunit alcohol dehydrogenase family)